MPNRLADAVSPYLRQHADNPVDWRPWGADAFAEAARRDVPVLVSIGYATCHWCHVMARESFSDPELAAHLNDRFVAVKVDREELPDVDAAYLAAAAAFTRNLGWPLTAFATPEGRVFFAGTYFPPEPRGGVPSFRQVLDAVTDAWLSRRAEVESTAEQVREALEAASRAAAANDPLPTPGQLDEAAAALATHEDREFGGFGVEPKFPAAPALGFLLAREPGRGAAERALEAMAASPLFDPIDGGFFRYATRRDWSEPHYERMLYDNAQLLRLYARVGGADTSAKVAQFLSTVLRTGVGFASAQDSESVVAGQRTEGGYYLLSAAERAAEQPPALDRKVLTGWNGLAVGALAEAGARLGRVEWVAEAASVADSLLDAHRLPGWRLVRASLDGRVSGAPATLEDYGCLADGLIDVALATGEVRYAIAARELVDQVLAGGRTAGTVFAVPGGADPVLEAQGMALRADVSEGAYPSGWSAAASAARRLYLLTAKQRYLDAARRAVGSFAATALANPIGYGALLEVASALSEPVTQLVAVAPDGAARVMRRPAGAPSSALFTSVTDAQAGAFAEAGFELFEGRASGADQALLYACTDFVCALPTPIA